jgi:hypothetical protein
VLLLLLLLLLRMRALPLLPSSAQPTCVCCPPGHCDLSLHRLIISLYLAQGGAQAVQLPLHRLRLQHSTTTVS